MAGNKSVNELTNASALQDGDSLVVFQDGETKQMPGSTFKNYVAQTAAPSIAAAAQSAEDASDSADAAEENALKAEGHAVGKQNGSSVPSTSPYYKNNAKYFSEQAAAWARGSYPYGSPSDTNNAKFYAEQASNKVLQALQNAHQAEAWAVGMMDGQSVSPEDEQWQNNAKYHSDIAKDHRENAEAWAVGTKNGVDVPATADQHENHSKFWAGEASGFATSANQSKVAAQTAAEQAAQSAEDADESAQSIENTRQTLIRAVNEAEAKADSAIQIATDAENGMAEFDNQLDALESQIQQFRYESGSYAQELEVDNQGLVYLLNNGERIAGPYGPFAGGGGGGGSGNNAVLTVANASGWLSKTIADGSPCPVSITWSSLENEIPTGDGTAKITVNGAVKAMLNIHQGTITIDIAPYMITGANVVKVNIADVYENNKTINYSVNVVTLSLSSSFDPTRTYSSSFLFQYTPLGNVEKTIHFIVDDTQIGTNVTSLSGRQLSYTIPAQTNGSHRLHVYFDCVINGETVESNHLYYDVMCYDGVSTDPIISCAYNVDSVTQYTTLVIPYIVFTPNSLTSAVTLTVNGELASSITVDRTQQTFSYRADDTGALTIVIASGVTSKTISLTVTESNIDVEAETEALALYLSSRGRSNNEEHPDTWVYNDISCTFTGFNHRSDGWQNDGNGITVLRVAGDARLTIPYKPFATDFRGTGKTIEIEFATRTVMDYDAVIMSCMSGGKGFSLTAQKALLKSEASEISMQYKEDEHVRISFAVEKRSENRLLYIYVNGIMSGVVQYPDNDDFSQATPVDITVGSNDCTIDLYCIRIYDNDLTRVQLLENWIADTQSIDDMLARYERNNVYDAYGNIVIAKLPKNLPYMIIECSELPQYKGDKKIVNITYTDPVSPSKSFTSIGAQIDNQGTTSQYYARKNYKIKFKNGFDMNDGSHSSKYAMRADSIPTNTFTFKADVASSEGANNVELARLYNDTCVYKTPPQKDDPHIRQGIDGFPIVVFWNDGTTTSFLGKYNFNNDKGTKAVFGFKSGDESWEILNNTSNRVLWKSADYTGDDWLNDFEARYPDTDPPYINPARLSQLAAWLVTTDQEAATNDPLPQSVTYEEVTYTTDTAAYRLAKFKAELSQYMEKDAVVYYYLFTELFLMVDSRAKNAFPTVMGDSKWFSLPYDFDTAIGINNEGTLVFSYNLEDIDQVGTADVFNGQKSVLWINLRQAFFDDIRSMYKTLRSTGALSYSKVEQAFEEHQSKWGEAIFNEDAYFKYLQPLIDDGNGAYLAMLQGSKAEQRKWWLYNRFRYIDSKYNAGDSRSDVIQLRGYAKSNVTVTPYADVYASVKFGSYLQQTRAERNHSYEIVCPLDNVNDTEIYVYSASQLASVGDLSGLKVGFADFSMGTKLQSIKIGDNSALYVNPNLKELYLGNNVLLRSLDVRNCTGLGQGDMKSVDIRGCSNIEHVYFDGTNITGLSLPNGGILKTLHLPQTVTNLTILNQTAITDFTMLSYANITTLWLDNVSSAVNSKAILNAISANSRVRLIGINWEATDGTEIAALVAKLDTMRGLDESGGNVDTAQVSGRIHTGSLTGAQIAEWNAKYPYISFEADSILAYLTYKSYDGVTTLKTVTCLDGVPQDTAPAGPTRPATPTNIFTFIGWSKSMNATTVDADAETNVLADRSIYAAYSVQGQVYRVRFLNGSTVLQTYDSVPYGGSVTYTGSEPQYTGGEAGDWVFNGWNPEPTNIQDNTDCIAQFRDASSPLIKYLKHTITSYESPSNTKIASYAFYRQNSLVSAKAPATTVETNAFNACSNLTTVELSGTAAATIAAQAFVNCPKLEAVIIRSTAMSTLSNVNAFSGTKIASGMGAIYVPSNLVATYKTNAAWKNFFIASIDDYPLTDMKRMEGI